MPDLYETVIDVNYGVIISIGRGIVSGVGSVVCGEFEICDDLEVWL